jgi:hypothetical protein
VSNSRIYRGAIVAALCSIAGTAAAGVELLGGKSTDTKLNLNADLDLAGFLESDPWFGKSQEFLGADTNHWLELGFRPKLTFETSLGRGTLVAALSGVYTQTWGNDASGLGIGHDRHEAVTLEEANIGWKAKDLFPGGPNEFSITIGNLDYSIGSGIIINDGGGDGGGRGGWYIGMRKAFEEAVLARFKTSRWLIEGFHLNNHPRAGGVKGEADGANVEYTFAEAVLGGSYIWVNPNLPGANPLNVLSGRVDWGGERNLHVRGEYVQERNAQIDSAGWYGEIVYTAKGARWSPVFSYRYAHFDGNKPGTAKDEQFREIAYGFTDYGTWYQGEIAGNYPLGNANVVSQMVRVKLKPLETLTTSVIYYRFTLDQPSALAPNVTNDHFGDEIDLTADWQATDKLLLTGVFGALLPGDAAKQWTGGNKAWLSSMLLVSYSW